MCGVAYIINILMYVGGVVVSDSACQPNGQSVRVWAHHCTSEWMVQLRTLIHKPVLTGMVGRAAIG
jgi:hypothetical protein